jgi:hypothetical protein
MSKRHRILQLTDMDVGLFVSYEITAEALTTKLFRFFTLNTIPLPKVMDLREANTEDVTRLNRVNWFDFKFTRKRLCPVYTLQSAENRPRIFMRLERGSYIEMKRALEHLSNA